jgi:hypothetical protein
MQRNGGLEVAIKVFDCIPGQNVVIYAMLDRLYANLLQKSIRP